MSSMIDDWVRAEVKAQNDALEAACEQMLARPGPLGVLLEQWEDMGWRVTLTADEEPMTITTRYREGPMPR